jgi:hypothetical protein
LAPHNVSQRSLRVRYYYFVYAVKSDIPFDHFCLLLEPTVFQENPQAVPDTYFQTAKRVLGFRIKEFEAPVFSKKSRSRITLAPP